MIPTDQSPKARAKRRRKWLAALLSLLMPGLGQLYNGEGRRALRFFAVVAGVEIGFLLLRLLKLQGTITFWFLAVVGAIALIVTIVSAVAAFRRARRMPVTVLARYQRWWIYVSVFALLSLVAWGAEGSFGDVRCDTTGECFNGDLRMTVPSVIPANYNLRSSSMEPTMQPSDYVLADRRYFQAHEPQAGDLATFVLPSDRKVIYVKRIIGMPGDLVQLIDGELHVNGVPVERRQIENFVPPAGGIARLAQYVEVLPNGRSYRIIKRTDGGPLNNTPAYRVPPGHYFVLGDNRDNSLDSRMPRVGFVPEENLLDRPYRVIWAKFWSRVGSRIE